MNTDHKRNKVTVRGRTQSRSSKGGTKGGAMLPWVPSDRLRQVREESRVKNEWNLIFFLQVLSRTGLYLGLIIYASVGGKVSSQLWNPPPCCLLIKSSSPLFQIFQELESPSELASLKRHCTLLMNERELFLHSAVNSSCDGMEVSETCLPYLRHN